MRFKVKPQKHKQPHLLPSNQKPIKPVLSNPKSTCSLSVRAVSCQQQCSGKWRKRFKPTSVTFASTKVRKPNRLMPSPTPKETTFTLLRVSTTQHQKQGKNCSDTN